MKIAAAGTGYFSQFHYDAWARCSEVEVVGVADLNIATAEQVADKFGARAYDSVAVMLEETSPNLLDIITPPPTHLDMISLAAQHRVNVICQKPFCDDLETAKHAVRVGEEAGIDITVHENFRFQPWYQVIKKELQRNRFGNIYRASFRLRPGDGQGPNAYLDRQPYFQSMKRFLIHETAIHLIDVFRYLFGEVRSVWADLEQFNPAIAGEDSCLIVLEFDGKMRGVLDGNRLSDHVAENTRRTMGEMTIEGEKGVLSLDGNGSVGFRGHGQSDIETISFEWRDHGFGGDCVYHFTRHVVEHYMNGKTRCNSGRDYLANQEIEEAVYASAGDGTKRCRPFC